eukprot:186825-Chlamydomonas_euryale.AAC.1
MPKQPLFRIPKVFPPRCAVSYHPHAALVASIGIASSSSGPNLLRSGRILLRLSGWPPGWSLLQGAASSIRGFSPYTALIRLWRYGFFIDHVQVHVKFVQNSMDGWMDGWMRGSGRKVGGRVRRTHHARQAVASIV